jgi:hypothetical protein
VILDAVPKNLVAGDTWRWLRSFSDYPAPTWTVTYYFENSTKAFSVDATASGADHSVTIAAATSAQYPPGRYRWAARAASGGVAETIEGEFGWLEVAPNPAASGTRDHRSWARRTLDALEATLEGKATSDQLAMSINGRSISRIPLPELLEWRNKLRGEVRTEEGGNDAGLGRNIKVRFGRA